jgi:hypothetical protein
VRTSLRLHGYGSVPTHAEAAAQQGNPRRSSIMFETIHADALRITEGRTNSINGHGGRCSCRALAEAMHCKPETISLSYCQGVLRKHWTMECDHYCRLPPSGPDAGEKWRHFGAMDPVKAILIVNG